MRYPAFPVGAFVAAFLILIPAPRYWRKKNHPTLSLIAWLFILNVVYGVNSLVWSDDVEVKVRVWCDISTKLIIGACVALPACNLRISKHLALIGGRQATRLDDKDRRTIFLFDLGFCWVVPAIFMALHYIVQDHRYNVLPYIGCRAATHKSILGILIVWVPPLLLCVGTSVYAGIALWHFVRRRRELLSYLQASGSHMSTNRYQRLVALSVILMVWGTTLTSLNIWVIIRPGLKRWVGLKKVHSHWNHVNNSLWEMMDSRTRRIMMVTWWVIPVSTLISFVLLGSGGDVVKEYRRVGEAILRIIPSRVLPKRIKRFSKGTVVAPMRPPSCSSFGGPPPSLPTNSPPTNQAFRELPSTRPLRSPCSVMGPPRSKTQSQLSEKLNERGWSARSESARLGPSRSDNTEGGLYNSASGMGTATVAVPQSALMRGSV